MSLLELKVTNFRCFAQAQLPLDQLTVLIGENDAGKTALLDAIEMLLGAQRPAIGDVTRGPDNKPATHMMIEGDIPLGEGTEIATRLSVNGQSSVLRMRRTWSSADMASQLEVFGTRFEDERFDSFHKLNADEMRDALTFLNVEPGSSKALRQQQFEEAFAANRIPMVSGWIPVKPSDIAAAVPVVQRVSSADYADPGAKLHALVQTAARSAIEKYREEKPEAFDGARARVLQASSELETALLPYLRETLPGLEKIRLRTVPDFNRPNVDCEVELILGGQMRTLAELGYGSSRRAWIALEHYAAGSTNLSRPVIRLYDEPDTNLHYEAQRTLFRAIRDLAGASKACTTVVCTHAVTLIDSVSPQALRTIKRAAAAAHTIESLRGLGSEHDFEMLDEIGNTLGLTNTALLFERAFLLVEGDTERNALPHLYKRLFTRRPVEDGIRIVSLDTCGSWRSVVNVLVAARKPMIHLLLDQDCTESSSAKLTEGILRDHGVSTDRVALIGSKEFEDAFDDEAWCTTLQAEYSKEDGTSWNPEEIAALRASEKFSTALRNYVRSRTITSQRHAVRKTDLGTAIGRHCPEDRIPEPLVKLFRDVRRTAGI